MDCTLSMPGMQGRKRKCMTFAPVCKNRPALHCPHGTYADSKVRFVEPLLPDVGSGVVPFSKADVKITLVTLICPAIRRRPQRPMTCRPTRRDIWRCTLEAVVAVALSDRQQWVDHCPTTASSQRRAYPSLLRSHRGFAYNY
jgi:hypothetical protein